MKHKFLFLLGLLLFLLPLGAAGEDIDPTGACAMTLTMEAGEEPIGGFPFRLYYVASVNAQGKFTPEGRFQNYPVELNGLTTQQFADLAQTLDAYARQDGLTPLKTGTTGASGSLFFDALDTGLYLVGGSAAVLDGKSIATDPFLVSLPSLDGSGNWAYKLILSPKFSSAPVPEAPETVSYRVLKLWQGDVEEFRPEKIQVRLLQDGVVYDTVELTKEGAWRHSWDSLPKYAGDGHRIAWQLTEEVPAHYSVRLGREGDTFLLENTYEPDTVTLTRRVQKRWDDAGYSSKRPGSVTVELLRNGQVYDTVTLTAAGNWQYTWENLPSKDSLWTVREVVPQGYKATVWQEGDTFVLQNSFLSAKLPQTGQLWWPVPILALGGLTLVAIGLGLKKRQRHE